MSDIGLMLFIVVTGLLGGAFVASSRWPLFSDWIEDAGERFFEWFQVPHHAAFTLGTLMCSASAPFEFGLIEGPELISASLMWATGLFLLASGTGFWLNNICQKRRKGGQHETD